MIDQMVLQNLLAYAAVFLALIWISRRIYRTVSSALKQHPSATASSCSGCSNRQAPSSANGPKIKPLVQLQVKDREPTR